MKPKKIQVVRLSIKPSFILVSEFEETIVFYHVDFSRKMVPEDTGVWRIKYK